MNEEAKEEKVMAMDKNPLPNKKVKIVPVIREGGWLPKDHAAAFLHEDATRKYLVPLAGKNRVHNILSRDERIYLENVLARDLNPNLDPKDNYWMNTSVPLKDEILVLDLSDPYDFIKYKIIESNKNEISPSWEERLNKGTYKFAICDVEYEANARAAKSKIKRDAYKKFAEICQTRTKMADFLTLYYQDKPGKRVPEDATHEMLESEIDQILEGDLTGFNSVSQDKEYDNKVFIVKAMLKKAIEKRNGTYMTPEGNILAHNDDDMIAWIKNPLNNEELIKIENRVNAL